MSNVFTALKDWAIHSPADDFWFCSAILLVATIVGFFFAFKNMHNKRIIEDTPTSKIRSAAQGYLELVGHGYLMEGLPVISPLSGTTCTWYEYKVEERHHNGKNSEWKTIRKGISDELFLIKDETGQCIIDPEGAHVTVSRKEVWFGKTSSPILGSLPTRKKRGFFTSLIVNNKYRYTEKLLFSGESLYAIGLYKTVGGAVQALM